ncbi:MAG TPA: LysM domain-containing protein [Solirubrobacterales bacterium]|jgi:LysM repeat protein
MTQRYSSLTRTFAVTAVACGFLILVVVIASSLSGGEDSQGGNGAQPGKAAGGSSSGGKEAPTTYVVQNGDTLTSIAHDTGVSVARIQALNPGVDPQILISGEKLKLR